MNIYDSDGNRRAGEIRFFEDAAMFVSCLGEGATVRHGGAILWHEGRERQPAGESFDEAAAIMIQRYEVLEKNRRVASGA